MISVHDCEHEEIQFNSGDYYIYCLGCGSKWVRHNLHDMEYTISDGRAIGADPSAANKGKGGGLSGHKRYKVKEKENNGWLAHI